jgi:hypothetical protein
MSLAAKLVHAVCVRAFPAEKFDPESEESDTARAQADTARLGCGDALLAFLQAVSRLWGRACELPTPSLECRWKCLLWSRLKRFAFQYGDVLSFMDSAQLVVLYPLPEGTVSLCPIAGWSFSRTPLAHVC